MSTISIPIVNGSSTTSFDGVNQFTLQLPSSGFNSDKHEVSMKSLSIYYSWQNISAAKGNNTFSYIWPSDGITYSVVVPDGIWSFDDISSYLQQLMSSRGHYLVDVSGEKAFYLGFLVNSVQYCLSLTCSPLPAVLPAGWSNPGAIDLVAAGGRVPRLVVPNDPVSRLFGFAIGVYPAADQTALYQVNSSSPPQITDVTSLFLLCNMVNSSGYSLTSSVLASFNVPDAQRPGSLISLAPNILDWVPAQDSVNFQTIQVRLVDQLMRPVTIKDPTGAVIILNIRKR